MAIAKVHGPHLHKIVNSVLKAGPEPEDKVGYAEMIERATKMAGELGLNVVANKSCSPEKLARISRALGPNALAELKTPEGFARVVRILEREAPDKFVELTRKAAERLASPEGQKILEKFMPELVSPKTSGAANSRDVGSQLCSAA